MIYEKTDKVLVVHIPLKQEIYNPYSEEVEGETDAVIGIVAGNEYTLSHLIEMEYKDKSPQEGTPILYCETKEELKELCKEIGCDVWELLLCDTCKKAIRGTFTINKKGNQCFDCEH